MGSIFATLQETLNSQRKTLQELSGFYDAMRAPGFNPMFYATPGFDAYASPTEIAAFFQDELPSGNAACELAIIGSNVKLLQTTIELIEVQNALHQKFPSPSIESTAKEDAAAYTDILDQAFRLNSENRQRAGHLSLDQNNFMKVVGEANDKYVAAIEGGIGTDTGALAAGALLQKIYELRMAIVDTAIEKAGFAMQRVDLNLSMSIVMKKAVDEGIVPRSHFIEGEIEKMMQDAHANIETIRPAHTAIQGFLGRVFDMDPDNDAVRDFKARVYVPASIKLLTEFSP